MAEIQKEVYFKYGITFQRLNKDYLWYAIYKDTIIDYDRYRDDLEERVYNYLFEIGVIKK
jgi:hypothetical protein